jgi:predicted enzyme related to lactoylglutathione lyase
MSSNIEAIIYPVGDLAAAKERFSKLLGLEPETDQPYYVGFKVSGHDVGLDPNGHKDGAVCYWRVDDIKQSLQALLDAGAQTVQDVKDVGGGKLVASVRDTDGNLIGLLQPPA